MKDHAGLPIGKGSSKWKPHLNVGRQCLGRLFRSGQDPVVVTPPPSIEAEIAARIKQKLIIMDESVLLKNGQTLLLGPTTEATGLNLHPFQKRAAKRLLRQIKKTVVEPSH